MRFRRAFPGVGPFCVLAVLLLSGSTTAEEIAEIAKSPTLLETTRARPKAYGVENYSVTIVPAVAFLPSSNADPYFTPGNLGRNGAANTVTNFYAPLFLPEGVVIDYIGLNSQTDAPNAIGVALYSRDAHGNLTTLADFASQVHSWETDYLALALGEFPLHGNEALILHVQQGSFPTLQFFGWVEVWWKRTVRAPGTPTFNDVPGDHPFFQFIEALAESGITAGCGSGNYCPDAPLTRGQMAVFLAKALGLHWGFAGPPN